MFGGWGEREREGGWKLGVKSTERTKIEQELMSLWQILKLCSLHRGISKGGEGTVSYKR
jgi:hypothetical protein